MSAAALAFLVGLTVLLAALFIVVVLWWREAGQLGRLVNGATRSEATERLRGPLGDGAVVLEQALTSKRAVDESLAAAIATVCQAPLGAPVIQGLAIDTLLVIGALAPFLAALLGSADAIAALPAAVETRGEGGSSYVLAVSAIPAAFSGIAQGAKLSAMLVMIAAATAVCRYALLRPEAREARALRALVHATAHSAPEAKVPQSAKLLALLAPTTGLAPGLVGSVLFVALSGAAVASLAVSAPLRAGNAVPLTYLGWPTSIKVESPFAQPPISSAGQVIQSGPSLIFARDTVTLHGEPMTLLENGGLAANWQKEALVSPRMPTGSRPLVVAGEGTALTTVVGVMQFLAERHGMPDYQLVVRRAPPVVRTSAAIQAVLPVSLGDAAAQAVVLEVDATSVKLGGQPIDLDRADGIRALRAALGPGAPRIGVQTRGALTYGRLVAILSRADGLCDGGLECGLPGRGISAVLTHLPASE